MFFVEQTHWVKFNVAVGGQFFFCSIQCFFCGLEKVNATELGAVLDEFCRGVTVKAATVASHTPTTGACIAIRRPGAALW